MSDDGLLGFIESVSGDAHLRIEEELGDGFVRLRTAEAERRQAKHDIRAVEDIIIEILRNARDADADVIFLATTREGDRRSITVVDNGSGIPEALKDRIFEPRVTSKLDSMVMDTWGVHGRGMALYSIRCNTVSAQVLDTKVGSGSAIGILIDSTELSERTDQSTLPEIERQEDGRYQVVRGPHNIARTVAEFSVEHRHDVEVYLGSPAEIAATMMEYGHHRLSDKQLLFCDDLSELPLCLRLAACTDAAELADQAQRLGLSLSERTAYRILHNQIQPQKALIDRIVKGSSVAPRKPDIFKDSRGLKIADEDIASFSRHLEEAFEAVAGRYYIALTKMPKVTVTKNSIHVRFDFDKDL
jgi:hypothetical protein